MRRPELLRRAVASALANERPGLDVSITVIDNASPEDPRAPLRAEFGDRVRVLVQDRNRGVVANWNRCREHGEAAGADAWLMLEDDNFLEPGYLAATVPVLERHPKVDLVFSACWEFDDAGHRRVWAPWSAEGAGLQEGPLGRREPLLWAFTCPVRVSALLVRSAPHLRGLPSYPADVPGPLDVAGLGRLAMAAREAYFVAAPLMHYYLNPKSISAALAQDRERSTCEVLRAFRRNAEALQATGRFALDDWRTVARHAPIDRLMAAVLAASLGPAAKVRDLRGALLDTLVERAGEIRGWKGPATRVLGRTLWSLAAWKINRAARRQALALRTTDFDAAPP